MEMGIEMRRFFKKEVLKTMKEAATCDIIFGQVESAEPLRIFVDQFTVLQGKDLVLTQSVTDYETEISFDDPEVKQVYTTWDMDEREESSPAKISFKQKEKHKVTIYNALCEGDLVVMLRQSGGQRFIVLDKVV